MSIEYCINHDQRLVLAVARGTVSDQDIFEYQRTVWSRSDVAGYNELMDMSEVTHIVPPPLARIREMALLAARMDAASTASKFAIVAPGDLAYGLARMYQAYRNLESSGTKQVGVFRALTDARAFLGLQAIPQEIKTAAVFRTNESA
jgi:hypothetical protein